MKKLKNTNKGITLIALVITIIVMLILVAVTITMAINGGLFEYAGKAVSEMQNAINAEQQLADGKIKIGDKWYASIDDYINNNPITTGIEVNPAEITLKKNEEGAEGTEVLTGTITASVFGMESEPEITWETSSDAITLSSTTGKTVTVTAAGTQNTEATVTAKCTYEGKEYTQACKVTLEMIKKPVEIARGDFVKYDVEYTDVYYDTYEYSSTNGWRLLHYTDNGDGTISDIKLISTGIPAKLYYYYTDTTNNDWYVTDGTKLGSFKEILGGTDFVFYTGTDTYYALQVAAGMYYNFGNIKFAYGTANRGKGLGYFTSIIVNGTTYNEDNLAEKTGNDLFKVGNNIETVRLLTLKEVNVAVGRTDIDSTSEILKTEDSIGLYKLEQLSSILRGYTYSSGFYLLASPYPGGANKNVCYIQYNGYKSSSISDNGVRPVIQFKSNVNFTVESNTDATTGITYLTLTPVA